MEEKDYLPASKAIYWAGVVFSFGLRIGAIPLETFWNDPMIALIAVIVSVFISLFSWFSAGIFIGELSIN